MALQKLGKYEIRSELGRGAMGVVYKAYDPLLEREVALKTMMASMGAMDGESKSRFYREARSAAKLTHRNIVTIYDMGEEQGIPFIAMEYLDGIDLHRKLKFGGPLPLREGLDIICQVLHGLNYAHQFQIVHRDIKPANIYILRNGTAKILDFGIAKLASSEMTRTGMVLGTVDYMSPEQIRADKAVDGRSDLFSAGVILYEFIAGRRPFPGETITSVMYKIVHEPPPALPDEREIPEALASVVNRALSKTPDERFASGQEFASALESVISEIDASIPTMRVEGGKGDSMARLKSARRLYDSGSFEDSVSVLREVLESDPGNEEAARLMSVVEKRAAGDPTMILEPEEEAPAATGSSIEEILEEVEEERRQTTEATGPRSEAGARDLTLRLEESGVGTGDHRAPHEGDAAGTANGAVPATEMMESPEPPPPPAAPQGPPSGAAAPPSPPTPDVAGRPAPVGEVPPTTAMESPAETPAKPAPSPPPSRKGKKGKQGGKGKQKKAAPAPAPPAPAPARPLPAAVPPKAPSSGLSPAMLGVVALVIVAAAVGGWLWLSGGESPPPAGTEMAEPPAGTEAPSGPPVAPPAAAGHLAVDAQPWAEVASVRDRASGEAVDLSAAGLAGGDATTPLVLDLPEGTYDVVLRHPEFGEVTVTEVRVAPGQVTPVIRTMPGFSYTSKLPSAR